ncbi:MAG: hypothetical protein HYY14_06455 [Candidatus Omnitrophica bacterium]|nr:hypothetical protein [Candidatus Omnitrophota bacterium]
MHKTRSTQYAVRSTKKIITRQMVVTAGPTQEPIDRVRFISNPSTGEMGVEIAREAARRGWSVTLILGPTPIAVPRGLRVIRVRTAREMRGAVLRAVKTARVLVMTAAVSDWRPARAVRGKMKRSAGPGLLRLVENPDILNSIPKRGGGRLWRVGFCLESGDFKREARRKLRDKKLDFIVANRLGRNGGPFGQKPVTVWILDRLGRSEWVRHAAKRKIARVVLNRLHGAMAE